MKRLWFGVLLFTLFSTLVSVPLGLAQSTGSLKLTLIDNGSVADTARFGELHGATSGLDIGLGEFELPPVPPSGAFDVRWIVSGVEGLSIDYRDTLNAQNKKNVWTLQFQPSASGYPVTITWDSTRLWTGFFQMYDAATGGGKLSVDMSIHGSVSITDNTVKSLTIVHTFTVSRNVSLQSGWNLVSVPVGVKSWDVSKIFPAYVSAYSYAGGYQPASTLAHGTGYWVNYPNPGTAALTGEPFASDTFAVVSGWNLIGSTFSTVATTSIQQVPASIVSSYFFSYSNGYKSTTSISSGQGVWVKSSQAGKLVLSSSSLSKSAQEAPTADLTKWNTITVTDAEGASGELLFSSKAGNLSEFDMPPKPPESVFDIRFSGDRFAGILPDTSSGLKMELQAAHGPVKVQWNIIDGGTYILNGLSAVPITLSARGSSVADQPGVTAEIQAASGNGRVSLPTKFELYQNYPNPFNPSTIIRYDVPTSSHVNITIYDLLGRQVGVLVNTDRAAGHYQATFNASRLPSGIYFYRLQAGTFQRARKFVFVK